MGSARRVNSMILADSSGFISPQRPLDRSHDSGAAAVTAP
jgi:hypothetical protein